MKTSMTPGSPLIPPSRDPKPSTPPSQSPSPQWPGDRWTWWQWVGALLVSLLVGGLAVWTLFIT